MSKNFKNTGNIGDQLKSNKGALLSNVGFAAHPAQWKEDGVDHINVSATHANTELGQWLNGRKSSPFRHPVLGQFRSVDNLALFIRSSSHDDRLRSMENFALMRKLVEQTGGMRRNVDFYDALVVHANYIRILLNPELMNMLINSTLPFDIYTVDRDTGLRQRFEPSRFLSYGYTAIRKALINRESVDLRGFHSGEDGVDIYKEVMLRIAPNYQGNSAEIVKRYEETRWALYDAYIQGKKSEEELQKEKADALAAKAAEKTAAKEAHRIKMAQQAEERRLKKEQRKKEAALPVEEIGGIGMTFAGEVEPRHAKEGTIWEDHNGNVWVRIVSNGSGLGKIWLSIEDLNGEQPLADFPEKRYLTTKLEGQNQLLDYCWENGWKLYNPITGESRYADKLVLDGPATWCDIVRLSEEHTSPLLSPEVQPIGGFSRGMTPCDQVIDEVAIVDVETDPVASANEGLQELQAEI